MSNMFNQPDDKRLKMLASLRQKKQPVKVRSSVKRDPQAESENMSLLYAFENDWNQLAPKRVEHNRFMRYFNGDQWGDKVPDPDNKGKMITERELISRTGVTPITQNILQQYIRNVCGQMLTNSYKSIVNARKNEDSEAAEMLTNALQACLEANENATLDINHIIAAHTFGISWAKITFGHDDERGITDGVVQFINEQRIAWNQDTEDPRLNRSLRRIGELHSYTLDELLNNFGKTEQDEKIIRELFYNSQDIHRYQMENVNQKASDVLDGGIDFWTTGTETNKYRVFEVWTKRSRRVLWANDRASAERPKIYEKNVNSVISSIDEENRRRQMLMIVNGMEAEDAELIEYEVRRETYWFVQFLTPQGISLLEMESPYEHNSHPYVEMTMPLIDGVSKPLFSDLVEMQRNINRQRTMADMLIASCGKNTLYISEDALDGRDISEYVDQLMKVNGVIVYKDKPGIRPPSFLQQNALNIGIFDVLRWDMQQIQQISGLSGAIQGQVAKSDTPASLYAQQAQNTMLNFVLLFNRFGDFCKRRDMKLLKTLIQYYTAPRYLETNSKTYGQVISEYIPEKARAIANSYSLVPSQGLDTPMFRDQMNNYLMDMLRGGLIPLDTFLNYTTLPFGKQLAQELQVARQQMVQNGRVSNETAENIQQQIKDNTNPRAAEMIQQIMGQNPRTREQHPINLAQGNLQ